MTLNVRQAANAAIQIVNPDITGTYYASTGYTTNAASKQIPTYAAGVSVALQLQAVTAQDLKHLEGMNVQGVLRSVHMRGNTQGVVRVASKGGDLLYFPEVPGGTSRIWLVVKVLETWVDWSHVIVNLQTDAAPPA